MKRLKVRHKLRTVSDLARHIGVKKSHLYELVDELTSDETTLYRRSREQQKKSGGTRQIDAPRDELKFVQKRINGTILQQTRIHKAASGGVRGKRLVDNLRLHAGKPMLTNFDLEEFFPSITDRQIYKTFRAIGAARDVANMLTRLTIVKGRVPQGAPTSTMLANLVAGYVGSPSLDARIEGLCKRHRAGHGRWVDDIAISGPNYLPRLKPTV